MKNNNLLNTDLKAWSWLNAAHSHSLDAAKGSLIVDIDAPTDFWQKTHYGQYSADNGHFFNTVVRQDFVLSTQLTLIPAHEYDQAGLMIRLSSDDWIKISVEYNPDGKSYLGSVVTQSGYSDWSYIEWEGSDFDLGFRIQRDSGDYTLQYAVLEGQWKDLRFCHLLADKGKTPILAGIYAASPKAKGGKVLFTSVELESRSLADE